jgi:hypothetical protein
MYDFPTWVRVLYVVGFVGTFYVSYFQMRRHVSWFVSVFGWRDWSRARMAGYVIKTILIALIPVLNVSCVFCFIAINSLSFIARQSTSETTLLGRVRHWLFEDRPYRHKAADAVPYSRYG